MKSIEGRSKRAGKRVRKSITNRGRFNLYLDETLYKRFRRECKAAGYSASVVVEKLMASFVGR